MLPIAITGASPNGAGPQNNGVEAERRRRQRMFQFGLMVCLVLLILDSRFKEPNTPKPSNSAQAGRTEDYPPMTDSESKKLGSIVKDDAVGIAVGRFPRDVSGLYRGSWDAAEYDQSTKQMQSGKSGVEASPPLKRLGFQTSSGRMIMQLQMHSINSISELQYIQGIVRVVDGFYATTKRDLITPIEGVFVQRWGALALLTTPSEGQHIVISWPRNPTNVQPSGSAAAQSVPPSQDEHQPAGKDGHILPHTISTQSARKLLAALEEPVLRVIQADDKNELGVEIDGEIKDNAENIHIFSRDSQHAHLRLNMNAIRSAVDFSAPHYFSIDSHYSDSIYHGIQVFNKANSQIASLQQHRSLLANEPVTTNTSFRTFSTPIGRSNLILSSLEWLGTGSASMAQQLHELATLAAREKWEDIIALSTNNRDTYAIAPSANARACSIAISFTTNPITHKMVKDTNSQERGTDTDVKSAQYTSGVYGSMYSDDCNFRINTTATAIHFNSERVLSKAMYYSIVMTLMCVAQTTAIIFQLRYSRNPASASKVSALCIGAQAVLDAMICVVHLLLCAFLPPLFTAFVTVALFKLVIFCVFEIRYILLIYQARFAQELAVEGWAGLRRRMAILHARFYAALFIAMGLLYWLIEYPSVLVLLLYSYWVPQIVYSAYAGLKKPFHPLYLWLSATTRLFIPLYFYGCPVNVISQFSTYKTSPHACALVVFWTFVQVGVLYLQDKMGPRFFVPAYLLPPKYNYHRPLPNSLRREAPNTVEDGAATGLIECAICYSGVNSRTQEYMITPCDHLFHDGCLSQWMDIKLECPVCRALLPPTDD